MIKTDKKTAYSKTYFYQQTKNNLFGFWNSYTC